MAHDGDIRAMRFRRCIAAVFVCIASGVVLRACSELFRAMVVLRELSSINALNDVRWVCLKLAACVLVGVTVAVAALCVKRTAISALVFLLGLGCILCLYQLPSMIVHTARISVIIASFCLSGLLAVATVVMIMLRGSTQEGFCGCGYQLTGNVSGTCPECGRRCK